MPDRAGFALAFADASGLDPEVVLGWSRWENDDIHEKRRPYNWLNWKKDADIQSIPFTVCDPATDGGCFPGYATLTLALQAGLTRLHSNRYDAIRASAGKSQAIQLDAIRNSDWGTKHITAVKFTDTQLMWAWISWYLGEGWAHAADIGARNQAHRPRVFPRPIPDEWWTQLKKIQDGRKH